MADVVWSDAALHELTEIRAYITIFDPVAADRIVMKLIALGDGPATFPNRGRPVGDGSREMVTVPPYILRYDVDDDAVFITSIRHGARRPD